MDDDEQPFKASRRFSCEKALEAFRLIAPHKKEYLLEAKAYRSTIQYASVWRGWTLSLLPSDHDYLLRSEDFDRRLGTLAVAKRPPCLWHIAPSRAEGAS